MSYQNLDTEITSSDTEGFRDVLSEAQTTSEVVSTNNGAGIPQND